MNRAQRYLRVAPERVPLWRALVGELLLPVALAAAGVAFVLWVLGCTL